MKGATLADAAIIGTEELYRVIEGLHIEIQNLQTENQILKALIGE